MRAVVVVQALQGLRRHLVIWLSERASELELTAVMDAVVHSASTGASRGTSASWSWNFVQGSLGRFAVAPSHAMITTSNPAPAGAEAMDVESSDDAKSQWERPWCRDCTFLEMTVDSQLFQLTLQAASPQSLPAHVRAVADVKEIFGDVALQASLTDRLVLKQTYKIVGSAHKLHFWQTQPAKPSLHVFRPYYVNELNPWMRWLRRVCLTHRATGHWEAEGSKGFGLWVEARGNLAD